MLAMLMVSGMFVEVQAEPTIKETIAFINKVMKSHEFSSEWHVNGGMAGNSVYTKPSFKLLDECKIIVSYSQKSSGISKMFSGDYTVRIDLAKQKFEDSIFKIKDTNGLSSIHILHMKNGHKRKERYVTYTLFPVKIHGKYDAKVTKAVKHLSDKCYEKYSTKSNDPF